MKIFRSVIIVLLALVAAPSLAIASDSSANIVTNESYTTPAVASTPSNDDLVNQHCTVEVKLVGVPGMRETSASVNIENDGSVNLGRNMNGAKRSVGNICAGTATTKKVVHPGDIVGRTLAENKPVPDGIKLVAVVR